MSDDLPKAIKLWGGNGASQRALQVWPWEERRFSAAIPKPRKSESAWPRAGSAELTLFNPVTVLRLLPLESWVCLLHVHPIRYCQLITLSRTLTPFLLRVPYHSFVRELINHLLRFCYVLGSWLVSRDTEKEDCWVRWRLCQWCAQVT